MIPNAGLDNIAAYPAWRHLTGSGNSASGQDWLGYAAISEDSAEPLATDTTIGTERARTNSTGGFNRTATAIRDPNTNRLGLSIERAYVIDVTDNWNITKYGYVPLSAGGNFSWIDLVRSDPNDPGSTPITLTLEDGDQLQLWCTFTVTVPWSVDLESFVITGSDGNDTNGTHDAYCGFHATGDSLSDSGDATQSITRIIKEIFWPSGIRAMEAFTGTPSTARDTGPADGSRSPSNNCVLEPYVSGDYYRDKVFTFMTAQANVTMTAIGIRSSTGGAGSSTQYGFKIVFDDPSTFTKENTHELSLTFRVSWQEA